MVSGFKVSLLEVAAPGLGRVNSFVSSNAPSYSNTSTIADCLILHF